MTFAPVGIRCPDHANVGAVKPSPARTIQNDAQRATRAVAAPATMVLIAINVIVYVITAVPGRRYQPPRREPISTWALQGAAVAERRLVAPRHLDVPARRHPPPRVQHARALLARHDRRAGTRHAEIPARLLRLRARRIGGSALVQLARVHGRCLRSDLRPHRRAPHPRVPRDRIAGRAGDGADPRQPAPHLPVPGSRSAATSAASSAGSSPPTG